MHWERFPADREERQEIENEAEQLLDGLAVAGGGRHVGDAAGVRRAEAREEHDCRSCRAEHAAEHSVPFAQAGRARVLDLLLTLDPAVPRQQDVVVFLDDEILG